MKKLLTIIFIGATLSLQAQDTLRVGHQFRHFDQLEMGTKKDLVYSEFNGKLAGMAFKTRTTEMVRVDGKELVKITHTWQSPGTEWSGKFEYWCEPQTMRPIQHIRTTKKLGTEAFRFEASQITGTDSVGDNAQKDFSLELTEPTFNWEIDLETYSLLPMRDGYHAVMNFYHPGGKTPPKFYHLKVTGSETLNMPDGSLMDCWIVFTDYGGTQPTRFWYTKAGQNFVKMEGKYNQMTIRKERIF